MENTNISHEPDGFYTMKVYNLHSKGEITSAMEDYLEMILRMQRSSIDLRVRNLSAKLHVKASSVSKMIQQLTRAGLVSSKKYGEFCLTEEGKSRAKYFMYRHNVLQRFLCYVNSSNNELEQVERIEHYVNEATVRNIEKLLQKLNVSETNGSQTSCTNIPTNVNTI